MKQNAINTFIQKRGLLAKKEVKSDDSKVDEDKPIEEPTKDNVVLDFN